MTASHYGSVCSRRSTTPRRPLVKQILFWSPKRGRVLEALQYGTDNEKSAVIDLSNQLRIEIKPNGLFIDSEIEFLAASADGVIDAEISDLKVAFDVIMHSELSNLYDIEKGGVVEIKCPISAKEVQSEEALLNIPAVKRMFDKEN